MRTLRFLVLPKKKKNKDNKDDKDKSIDQEMKSLEATYESISYVLE